VGAWPKSGADHRVHRRQIPGQTAAWCWRPDHPDFPQFRLYWFHFRNGNRLARAATGRNMILGRLDLPAEQSDLLARHGRLRLDPGRLRTGPRKRLAKVEKHYFAGRRCSRRPISWSVFTGSRTMRPGFMPYGSRPLPLDLAYRAAHSGERGRPYPGGAPMMQKGADPDIGRRCSPDRSRVESH